MNRRRLLATGAAALVLLTTLATAYAIGIPTGFPASPLRYDYAVKFICEPASVDIGSNPVQTIANDPQNAKNLGLAPGFYYTDINIHNPSYDTATVNLVLKFVIALPEDPNFGVSPSSPQQVTYNNGEAYSLRYVSLGPDAAVRIDCSSILNALATDAPRSCGTCSLAKGFVVIYPTGCPPPASSAVVPPCKTISNNSQLDVWSEYASQMCSVSSFATGTSVTCAPAPSLDVVQVQPSTFTP